MRTAHVLLAQRLSAMPDQSPGTHPVIQIITNCPSGQVNAFYMDPSDLSKVAIVTEFDHAPRNTKDPTELNQGDEVQFDVQDGLHKAVIWNGRKIRQREYSFDTYAIKNQN